MIPSCIHLRKMETDNLYAVKRCNLSISPPIADHRTIFSFLTCISIKFLATGCTKAPDNTETSASASSAGTETEALRNPKSPRPRLRKKQKPLLLKRQKNHVRSLRNIRYAADLSRPADRSMQVSMKRAS